MGRQACDRKGAVASETTIWIPLGFTIVFVLLQLLIFGIQMLTPQISDLGNPLSSASTASNPQIVRQQVGHRQVTVLHHYMMNYENYSAGLFGETLQHHIYCDQSFYEPDSCFTSAEIEDEYNLTVGAFLSPDNRTIGEGVFLYRPYRSAITYEYVEYNSKRTRESGFRVRQSLAQVTFMIPMKGGTRATASLEMDNWNLGLLRWTE